MTGKIGHDHGAAASNRRPLNGCVLPASVLILALPLLASCDDDNDCCFNNYPPTQVSQGLVAGNFSNDGHASIIATSTALYSGPVNPGNLEIYLSNGETGFAAEPLAADGNDPVYLATADLNGDKLPDVVSASAVDGTLNVFLNSAQAPGSFAAPLVLPSPGASQLAIGDMNGDGLPDLVSADYNVSLFLQTSPGVFAAPVSLYPAGANWVAVGDLDGDGIADVALTDAVGVKVLFHTGAAGSGTYAAPVAIFTQTPNANAQGVNLIAIADVNGDGLPDLVITDPGPTGDNAPTVDVLLQNAAQPGTFLAPVAYATPAQNLALSIVVTDVNGDGHPDIVIGGSNAVTVLLQDAATPGTFLAGTAYPAQNSSEIAVADVTGDGLPDIVVNSSGAPQPINGVLSNIPGVLPQLASAPGTFGALQILLLLAP